MGAAMTPTEKDFQVVASAAMDAKARGDMEQAQALDMIARRMNADLTNRASARRMKGVPRVRSAYIHWSDIPSVLF